MLILNILSNILLALIFVKQQGTDSTAAIGNFQGDINMSVKTTTLNILETINADLGQKTAYTMDAWRFNKSNGQNKTEGYITEAMKQDEFC